jgi:DNA-binding NarL/FixJ family response regulator
MDINPIEKRIITLLAQGKVDKEIAPVVNMKPRTVKKYVSNIFMKTGTVNRANLISFAYENKILSENGL